MAESGFRGTLERAGTFGSESIRNPVTRARTGDVVRSCGCSQSETADPSLAPVLAEAAHTGDLTIAPDDSAARQWIRDIGKIRTERPCEILPWT